MKTEEEAYIERLQPGWREENFSGEDTHVALDALCAEATDTAFDNLEALEKAARPAPWDFPVGGGGKLRVVVNGTGCNYHLSPDDLRLINELRNHGGTLIRQCKNLTATMADLDGVHDALKLDYNSSAAAAVRAIVAEVGSLRAQVKILREALDRGV
jgi:hypothetical protein